MKGMLLLLVSAALVASPALAQQASDPYPVTPGVGIGPLTVGMSITDATKVMGTPQPAMTKITSVVLPVPEGALAFGWAPSSEEQRQGAGPRDGFAVITDKAGMVYEVQGPFDTRYHTAEGLHVGSKANDVKGAFGTPSREKTSGHERYLIYDQRGIALLIQNNNRIFNYGRVNGIWVFAPHAAP